MLTRRWGRIINVTGMNAIQGYAGRANVSAAKHGLWGLTKALAREFGPHGVTVNAVSPGPIEGERDNPAQAAHIRSLGHAGPARSARSARGDRHDRGLPGLGRRRVISGQMIGANGAAQT